MPYRKAASVFPEPVGAPEASVTFSPHGSSAARLPAPPVAGSAARGRLRRGGPAGAEARTALLARPLPAPTGGREGRRALAAQGGSVASGAVVRHRHALARLASLRLLIGAAFVLGSLSAALAPAARAAPACRYRLQAATLSDPRATQVALTVTTSTPGCRAPNRLQSVRIRIYSRS